MKKRKIRSTMGVFFTTFLLLQIILLFLYKAFIVDIAKKNEENLVENTLQIYHNTMESVLERLDDNLDLLLGYRLLLTQLNGENNLEKVKAQYQMLQILKEKCQDTKEADAYVIVNCKDNSILIQRNGNITLWSFSGKEVYLKLELYISQGQFSQEILDFVNKDMEITEKKDGSGIGIKNVKEVLKMMYQQDHLLYLENLEPEGTKITIWIPKTLKCTDEEKDEER